MTVAIKLSAGELEGTTASISSLAIAVGDTVNEGDVIMELETDKVSMEVCAPVSGMIKSLKVNVGDEIKPEMVMGFISQETVAASIESEQVHSEPELNKDATDTKQQPEATNQAQKDSMHSRLSPAVRRLMTEHNLNINNIQGTGKQGRITREDIEIYLSKHVLEETKSEDECAVNNDAAPVITPPVTSDFASPDSPSINKPHSRMRKIIAEHMVTSLLHSAPHVTSVFEVDMTNVIAHRKWHKKACERLGFPLTYSAYFAYAIAAAVKTVPEVNARYHEDHLEVFQNVNLGVGTALGDEGLVVPVIRGIDSMQLYDIANALVKKTTMARTGKLTPDDMKGGTITISNHGVSGSLFATPIIINQPEVAIIGIGKLEKRAVVREVNGIDEIQIRPMCYVSLTIDHRALDAFQTNKFLSHFVHTLEDWEG